MKYIPPKPNTKEYYKKRNKEIRRLYRKRYTYEAIAEVYGITKQRVAIICRDIKKDLLISKPQ